MHNLKSITHYDYRESIALLWLDLKTYWPSRYKKILKKGRVRPSVSTKSPSASRVRPSISATSPSVSSAASTLTNVRTCTTSPCTIATATKRATRISDELVNNRGFNLRRLTISAQDNHLPELVRSHSECQLHKWCFKNHKTARRVKKRLMLCPTCNVILCLECYSTFHKVHNLNTIINNFS